MIPLIDQEDREHSSLGFTFQCDDTAWSAATLLRRYPYFFQIQNSYFYHSLRLFDRRCAIHAMLGDATRQVDMRRTDPHTLTRFC